jgi:hypothetical protein
LSRHDISGGWVELRDPKKVPEKLRRPVKYAVFASQNVAAAVEAKTLTVDQFVSVDALTDAAIVALVAEWSFEQPLTGDGLLDLPGDAYDAVTELVKDHVLELMPNYSSDGMSDPKAPGDS